MLDRNAIILVKTIHKRQILFLAQEDVSLFDAIASSRRRGLDMDSAMGLYGGYSYYINVPIDSFN